MDPTPDRPRPSAARSSDRGALGVARPGHLGPGGREVAPMGGVGRAEASWGSPESTTPGLPAGPTPSPSRSAARNRLRRRAARGRGCEAPPRGGATRRASHTSRSASRWSRGSSRPREVRSLTPLTPDRGATLQPASRWIRAAPPTRRGARSGEARRLLPWHREPPQPPDQLLSGARSPRKSGGSCRGGWGPEIRSSSRP